MKRLLIIITLLATPLMATEEPLIKVLLAKDANAALLEARGAYQVQRKDNGTVLSYGNVGKRFACHAILDGLRWGEEYPECREITLVPRSEQTCMFVNGMQYKGAVTVYITKENRVTVINEVPVEDFLVSTLALQFDKPIKEEAMAALVIAARTNAFANARDGGPKKRWDVTAEEAGYFGVGVTHRKNGVETVVERTKYMVLESTKDGQPARNKGLTAEHAKELALRGFDAKKILSTAFPHTKVSTAQSVR